MIKSAAIQFHHQPGNKEYNLEKIEQYSREAAETGAQIAVFPEMCVTGYWHVRKLDKQAVRSLAEPVPGGPSSKKLRSLSKELSMIVCAGLIEEDSDGTLYNTYIAALPDGSWHKHRKLHCFISEHMASGNSYTVFDTHLGCRLGILICYDNNLIENARMTALLGADILLAPHQTGGCASKSPEAMSLIDPEVWHRRHEDPETLRREVNGPKGREWLLRWLPSRAHDNGMFLLFSNGIGIDDDEVRTGNSMVLDCYGAILAEAREPNDEIVYADIDLSKLPDCTGRRWMKARRPELYRPITVPTGNETSTREARFT